MLIDYIGWEIIKSFGIMARELPSAKKLGYRD